MSTNLTGRKPYQKDPTIEDEDYKVWIRTEPCLVCGTRIGVEAAHAHNNGMSRKCHAKGIVPLCWQDHREGKNAHHKIPRGFWAHHKIDLELAIEDYNTRYELATGKQIKREAPVRTYQQRERVRKSKKAKLPPALKAVLAAAKKKRGAA